MSMQWNRFFGSSKEEAEITTVDLLARVPLFEGLTRRELAAVERILHHREYMPGEVIFRQGERGLGMYIIRRGTVAIVLEPDDQELLLLQDGAFFGEMALLDDSVRSATAIARTECSVFGFFQPDLFDLIARDPRLGIKIVLLVARLATRRLRQANEKIVELTSQLSGGGSHGCYGG